MKRKGKKSISDVEWLKNYLEKAIDFWSSGLEEWTWTAYDLWRLISIIESHIGEVSGAEEAVEALSVFLNNALKSPKREYVSVWHPDSFLTDVLLDIIEIYDPEKADELRNEIESVESQ